jgi:hypothetical protein
MEAEIGRGRSLYKDQGVLILNQSAAPCAAVKCDSLLRLLQKSLHVESIQEKNRSQFLDKLSSTPDFILLSGIGKSAQDLIESRNEKANVSFFKYKPGYSLGLKLAKSRTSPFFK